MEKERDEKVIVWFKQLGMEEAAQTVTEHNEQDAKLLRQMVEKTKVRTFNSFIMFLSSHHSSLSTHNIYREMRRTEKRRPNLFVIIDNRKTLFYFNFA
jgi:hypothetical protein